MATQDERRNEREKDGDSRRERTLIPDISQLALPSLGESWSLSMLVWLIYYLR